MLDEEFLYHGTTRQSAENIRKTGFDPSNSKYGGHVFLTTTHREAQKYSKIAAGGGIGSVLKVHRSNLDPAHIHSDYGGIVRYTGKIDPSHVSDV